MNPQNNPNVTPGTSPNIEAVPPVGQQLDQQATEAARNIITPNVNTIQPYSAQAQPTATSNVPPPIAAPQSPQIITPFTPQPAEQAQTSMVDPIVNAPTASAAPNIGPTTPTAAAPLVSGFAATPQPNGGVPPIVMGGVDNPIVPPSMPGQKPVDGNNKKRKILLASGLSALVVIGLVSAFMFLWYIPNRPNNVWSTGLSRTGKQFDVLLEKMQDEESIKKLNKSAFTVKGTLTMDAQNYSVDVDSKYDPKNSASTIKVAGNGEQAESNFAIDAEVRTQLVTDAVFPNIYFKLSGFSSLGADTLLPGITQYDNKWIAVEQDFLKSLSEDAGQVNGQENLTEKDVLSIAADLNSVSKEYVFTDDTSKAVIQQTQFIATEESEGIKANHYKAKINTANARAYCASVIDKLSQNAAIKKSVNLPEQDYAAQVQNQKDACGEAQISETEFDIWVDKKIKVLHKVRQYEDLEKAKGEAMVEKARCEAEMSQYSEFMGPDFGAAQCSRFEDRIETGERYVEFGQVFKSRDEILLFAGSKSATDKNTSAARAEAKVNIKDLSIEGTIKASSDNESKYNLDIVMASKPFDGTIDASKPEGAIPIQQLIDSLGLDSQL